MWRGKRSLHYRNSGEVCSHSLDDLKCLLLSLEEHNLLGLHQSFKCHEKAHHNITHTKIVFSVFLWQHCSDLDHTTRPLLLVTASVDKISMKKPLRIDIDLQLAGGVAWVGRSSMEIRMEVIQPVQGVPACLSTCFVYLVIDLQKTC